MSEDLHTMVGLYVVDALDDDERDRFEAHLADCPSCSAEVSEFRATTSRLTGLMVENPPPALRASIMERIGVTRQSSPVTELEPRRSRVSRRWIAPVLVAAAAIAAVVLGISLGATHRALDRQEALTQVLTSPDATTVSLDGGTQPGDMRLVYSPSLKRSAVVVDGVADVPSDRTYALWFIGSDGPKPAGLFRTSDGHAAHIVDGTPEGYTALGVTEEPAGGSPQPTGPILFKGNVDQTQ